MRGCGSAYAGQTDGQEQQGEGRKGAGVAAIPCNCNGAPTVVAFCFATILGGEYVGSGLTIVVCAPAGGAHVKALEQPCLSSKRTLSGLERYIG